MEQGFCCDFYTFRGVQWSLDGSVSMRVLHVMVRLSAVGRACNIMVGERLPLSSENQIIV